jgi:hypothetical protein
VARVYKQQLNVVKDFQKYMNNHRTEFDHEAIEDGIKTKTGGQRGGMTNGTSSLKEGMSERQRAQVEESGRQRGQVEEQKRWKAEEKIRRADLRDTDDIIERIQNRQAEIRELEEAINQTTNQVGSRNGQLCHAFKVYAYHRTASRTFDS